MKNVNRLFIVGQIGSGKGMLAKALADKLGFTLIDIDFSLERKIGKEIKAILGAEGTGSFLNCQYEVMKSLITRQNVIINTDASIADSLANRKVLKSELVVFIDVSLPIQIERMSGTTKPLVNDGFFTNLLETLHQQRDNLYRQISDFTINSDDSALEKHVELIVKFISNNFKFKDQSLNTEVNNLNTIVFHKKTHKPINLTPQQAVCVKILSEGKSAKEIAREMNLSHRTVEGHLATVMEITGCSNSKELIGLYLS
ncbi:MAG: LuxR family transcriptional regulator [Tatlockia sp.]|nr:LuxR family transcriptional regulator [Tatlockia sp.]